MNRNPPYPVVLLLFFLSGATGLLYQVVWVRLFSFLFGATVLAISTVLAVFMAGLAAGGWWAGRHADRWRRPLRLYGYLEIGLGLYAGLVPLLLKVATPLYAPFYDSAGGPALLTALRVLLAAVVLLPPTFLMGATLPVLTRHSADGDGAARGGAGRRRVADLYALNTFGAVAGTVLATFVLLPALGLRATLLAGVVTNLLLGAVAIGLGGREAPPPEEADPATTRVLPFPRALLYGTAGVLGFSALAFEVLWTRALALSLGTTIYAFAIVLAVFLVGIGLGSAAAGVLMRRRTARPLLFAACPAVIGLLALGLLPVFSRLPEWFVALSASGAGTWGESVRLKFLLAGLPLLPPTLVSGAAFPLAVALDRVSAGHRAVGNVYAANTVGAILGSWAAGFLLLPWLGLQDGVRLAAALPLLATAAIALRWRGPSPGAARALAAGALLLGAAAGFLLPDWDRAGMTRGGFVLGSDLQRSGQKALGRDDSEIVFLEEGLSTTVTVRRENGAYTMQMNGVTEASTAGDLSTQVSVAALPLLLHAGPRDVLVIGLGGGITVATAGRFPGVESIDCVEISPAVARAASTLFAEANGHILEDPRVRLIEGDGRNHVALTDRSYDAIVSLPSHVWNSGIGSLMSSEFYALCRERLNPGGILCSWIQGYALSAEALRGVLAAVREQFPTVQLWRGAWGDLLIIAGEEGLAIDVERLRDRGSEPAIQALLTEADVPDLPSLLSLHLLAGPELDRWIGETPPNSDDHPTLEFAAPKLLYADPMPDLFRRLYAVPGGTAPALRNAPPALRQGLDSWRHARSLESEARLALRDGRGEAARRFLEEALPVLPGAQSIRRTLAGVLNLRASELSRRGDTAAAAGGFLRALEIDPTLPESYVNLARTYLVSGNVTTALELTDEGLRQRPGSADLLTVRAEALVRMRRFPEAETAAREALAGQPRHREAHAALADALDRQGRRDEAEAALAAGIALHPGAEDLESRLRKLRAER